MFHNGVAVTNPATKLFRFSKMASVWQHQREKKSEHPVQRANVATSSIIGMIWSQCSAVYLESKGPPFLFHYEQNTTCPTPASRGRGDATVLYIFTDFLCESVEFTTCLILGSNCLKKKFSRCLIQGAYIAFSRWGSFEDLQKTESRL